MTDTNVATETKTLSLKSLQSDIIARDGVLMDGIDAARAEARAAANEVGAVVRPEPKGVTKNGDPRLTVVQWTKYQVQATGHVNVRVRHLVEVGAFIGAWRGMARLLESRVTLPVGIYADILAGTLGLIVCEGVIYWTRR